MGRYLQRMQMLILIAFLWTPLASGCSEDSSEPGKTADTDTADADALPDADTSAPRDAHDAQTLDSERPDSERPDSETPDADSPPAPGAWQLPPGYFMPAKMPMTLVHPRVDDASDWAYSKNAHPGVRWEIPVVVQGGAWPFYYEIVDDGGAQGLEIGGELAREEVDGFIVHQLSDGYGVLSWEDPVAGAYEIMVKVTDQEGSSVDVPVSLTVGVEGWLFVDADNGNDESGDGSIGAPFKTLTPIRDEPDNFNRPRLYLSGVVPALGMGGDEDSKSLWSEDDNTAPAVWLGYPGREAVLEFNAAGRKFVLSVADFYMANLEVRHHEDFYQEGHYMHMFTAYGGTERFTFHDIHFSRFHGDGANERMGNTSIIMFTSHGPHPYVAVVNNRISGENGIFTSSYRVRHGVFENNIASGAQFVTGDNSTWAIFYMKSEDEFVSLRANQFLMDNVWDGSQGPGNLNGALGLDKSRNIEFAYNTIYTPFVEENSWRGGAIRVFTGSSHPGYEWTEDTPVWLYRNSLRHRMFFSGGNKDSMVDGTVINQKNILHGDPDDYGVWPEHARVTNEDNLEGEAFFDDDMRLTGAARDNHLGTHGAEIAVPVDL